MCYECQFKQSQSDKLILELNGKDPRYSGTLDIDSRIKRLGAYRVT